jgi:hypothetical protein
VITDVSTISYALNDCGLSFQLARADQKHLETFRESKDRPSSGPGQVVNAALYEHRRQSSTERDIHDSEPILDPLMLPTLPPTPHGPTPLSTRNISIQSTAERRHHHLYGCKYTLNADNAHGSAHVRAIQ